MYNLVYMDMDLLLLLWAPKSRLDCARRETDGYGYGSKHIKPIDPRSRMYIHTQTKKYKFVCPPPNTQHHRQTIRIYRISNSSSNIKMCPISKIYNDIWGWVYPICGVVEKGKWHVNICMFRPNQSYCYGLLITYPGKSSMTISL